MLLLLFIFPLCFSLDPTPFDINKVCYKCSVYSAAGKMKCENPGVCYANFCYSFVTSEGATMFLSGCAEDVTDFRIRSASVGLHCQSNGGVALCVCATGREACNYPDLPLNSTERLKKIQWVESEEVRLDNISTKVTGFSIDYAKRHAEYLKQDGLDKLPMHFNISRISSSSRRELLAFLAGLVVVAL